MKTADSDFIFTEIKNFNSWSKVVDAMASELPIIRSRIVQYENDLVSLDAQLKAKHGELADVEKQIKERRALASKGAADIHDQLNKRHVELVERESKIKMKEKTAQEQLDKANALLAAAESKTRRKSEVAA